MTKYFVDNIKIELLDHQFLDIAHGWMTKPPYQIITSSTYVGYLFVEFNVEDERSNLWLRVFRGLNEKCDIGGYRGVSLRTFLTSFDELEMKHRYQLVFDIEGCVLPLSVHLPEELFEV